MVRDHNAARTRAIMLSPSAAVPMRNSYKFAGRLVSYRLYHFLDDFGVRAGPYRGENLENILDGAAAKRTKPVRQQRPACPACQKRIRFRFWAGRIGKSKNRGVAYYSKVVLRHPVLFDLTGLFYRIPNQRAVKISSITAKSVLRKSSSRKAKPW